MNDADYEFHIDVGGTFTDVIAVDRASDRSDVFKLLSSGKSPGMIDSVDGVVIRDALRNDDHEGFWVGSRLNVLDRTGEVCWSGLVSDSSAGFLTVPDFANDIQTGTRYELESGEPAPVLAIRRYFGLRPGVPFPPLTLKLGTTRGTNALLTRSGARVAYVTTTGFGDALRIGNQARPELFSLVVKRPDSLFECAVEVRERLSVDGAVLTPLDVEHVASELRALRQSGIESLAVCLLHAWTNPAHELTIGRIAAEAGFEEVSLSHQVAPVPGLVPRGQTTVIDAYLNPVLREYLRTIEKAIPNGRMQLMTSVGGLVAAGRFTGKDSILSGPAGGVVGMARIANRSGYAKAIGFDMGGTSTDVCRYEGQFVRQQESIKAEVLISTPMLKIETVAAGGGSICGFDGLRLFVGPESASSDPGPACYGRGGPLTITDLNVWLGRVPASHFPFPLDRHAIQERLFSVLKRMEPDCEPRQTAANKLAEGLLAIANERMAQAIRTVSTAEGVSLDDAALVTFGGAGGQHACRLARMLNIPDVIIPSRAGVLSADGIGHAEVRRIQSTTLLRRWSPEWQSELDQTFRKLTDEARLFVIDEGVSADRIQSPILSVDVRVVGQESTLPVVIDESEALTSRFEQMHRQRFGYVPLNCDLEIVAAHAEVVGRSTTDDPLPEQCSGREPAATETLHVIFDGETTATSLFIRDQLLPGDRLTGPAILAEPTSTVVIEPGFIAEIDGFGDLHLKQTTQEHESVCIEVNAVTVELYQNRFAAIADRMGETLRRTAISTNVKERLDYSCAVFDAEGNLIANAPHVPVHLGAMSRTVKHQIASIDEVAAGDVFVTNHPYRGGSHLPDVTVMTPVFDADEAAILFWTANRAHHAEIGGITPGSMPPFSRKLGEEGVLLPAMKLCSAGESCMDEVADVLRSGEFPTRRLPDNLADLAAQIAANEQGGASLRQLAAGLSIDVLNSLVSSMRQLSASRVRDALTRWSGQTLCSVDHLDDGSPIKVELRVGQDNAVIDFGGTGPVLSSNLNANPAIVDAAVLYTLRCLIPHDVPLNAGMLDPVTIVVPECLLNPPLNAIAAESAAVVGGNVETSQRVVDVLLAAFDVVANSQGTMNNITFGDSSFGFYETIGGGTGATAEHAGEDAIHSHMTNTRLTDVEVIEHRYPLRVREFSIRNGSGGAGRFAGGNGMVREFEFLKPLTISLLTERRGEYVPSGSHGGADGAKGINLRIDSVTGEAVNVGGKASFDVAPGDRVRLETPGGGGWGETS